MLPSLPQRNARRHETNRSLLLVLKGYQDGVNHGACYAQRRAVPAWVSIAENGWYLLRTHRSGRSGSRALKSRFKGLGKS
jgi:hypothetical protein